MWKAKEHYPDLSAAKAISFDLETKDPDLTEKGPSTFRGGGYVIGFSVATEDGFAGYYPIKHPEGNLPEPQNARKWLKSILETPIPKIGANLLYDCEWAKADLGIDVQGPKWDVQIAGPLLDENYNSYSLNNLALRHFNETKEKTLLIQAGKEILGLSGKDEEIGEKVRGLLWKLPASYVGEYGEKDAALPIRIFREQEKQMAGKGLQGIFNLETELVDVLLAMRFQGIPVDVEKAHIVAEELEREHGQVMSNITRRVGFGVDIWSAPEIQKACEKLGLKFPLTEKENPSFAADWLSKQEHPFFKMLLDARQLDRCGAVFIKSKILDLQVNGILHPTYHQLRGERGGTTSGRLSSSNPNSQQFPSRNERLATKVRSLLVANKGCKWLCADVKAQEPRMTVHYANLLNLEGAAEARKAYVEDVDTDYHTLVGHMTGLIEMHGFDKGRKLAKEVNLGKAYGMGAKKYSEKYGKSLTEAYELFRLYDTKLPYVKQLSQHCERVVKNRGHLRTVLGRHCNFNLFGPARWAKGIVPKRYDEALKEFGHPVIRYFTYKALNRLIQGSSADMIKKAMVDCYKAGYTPTVSVHDELDFAGITEERQIREIKSLMENAIQITVPMLTECEVGPSWGEVEKIEL